MIRSKISGVVLCAVLAACADKPPKSPELSQALPHIPFPPGASFVSRAGGAEAIQLTLRSPIGADTVTAYYRDYFKSGGWKVVSDAKDAEGATVLLAQRDGPPLWVRVRPGKPGEGTLVELTGAVIPKHDSAAGRPAS